MGVAAPPILAKVIRPTGGVVGESRGLLGGWIGFNGLMLLPALLFMGVFVFYPAIRALAVCFQSWSGFSPAGDWIGLRNFTTLVHVERWRLASDDAIFVSALKNSVLWMLVGGVAHFSFAMLLATGLQNPHLRGKKFFQTLIIFPMFVSAIGTAMLWKQLYQPRGGMLNLMLGEFGLSDPVAGTPAWLHPDNGIYPILLVSLWATVGGQVILILAGLRQIPETLYEAARIDGASELRCFWHISLPLMRDILKIAAILWIIESLQVFGLVQGIMGPDIEPRLHVISTYMFNMAFNNRSNIYHMGQATAMAVLMVGITMGLIAILLAVYRGVFGKERLEF